MKFTVLFLSALAFVSATTDPVLMQISEHPASEAIFATLAVHLKADSTNVGFSTVLGLINDLIEDAKDQLQSNTLTWKRTDARCMVSAMNFKDKQDYFTNRAHTTLNYQKRDEQMQAMMTTNIEYLKRLTTFLSGFKKNHDELLEQLSNSGSSVMGQIHQAVIDTEMAIETVKNWNAGKASFVQEALNKVTDAYLQVHSYKLVIPTNLVQTGASNGVVQKRLVEWLGKLKLGFQAKYNQLSHTNTDSKDRAESISNGCKKSIEVAGKLLARTVDSEKYYKKSAESSAHAFDILTGLAAENSDLIKSNKDYCAVEKKNYGSSVVKLNEQIGIFKKLRDYFGTNFAKLSSYVKNKYQ